MKVMEYIESGIIEDYCLGLLKPAEMQAVANNAEEHEEIRKAIATYEDALVKYAAALAVEKPAGLKRKVFELIDNLEEEAAISADNIPLINKYSNADIWRNFVRPHLSEKLTRPFIVHDLPAKNGVEQFVFWTHQDLPHETHDDEQETILLLEGRCRCFINDEVIELNPGDFLSIPLHAEHNVEILDGPVLAVIQRVKVA